MALVGRDTETRDAHGPRPASAHRKVSPRVKGEGGGMHGNEPVRVVARGVLEELKARCQRFCGRLIALSAIARPWRAIAVAEDFNRMRFSTQLATLGLAASENCSRS